MNWLRLLKNRLYFRRIANAGKYKQGAHTTVDLSKVIITRKASGEISLGDYVMSSAELYSFLDQGTIHVGNCSFLGANTKIWALTKVHIGDRVLISHGVFICDSLTHPIDASIRHQQYMAKFGFPFPGEMELGGEPIIIEDDVWIAANAMVLKGVTIGRCSIVAAGSVVTKDVPPNVIVAGNPSRIVRKIP